MEIHANGQTLHVTETAWGEQVTDEEYLGRDG